MADAFRNRLKRFAPVGAALKTAAIVAGLAGGVLLFWQAMVDPDLLARNQSLADELSRLESRNGRLQSENAQLKAEIGRLRDQDAESVHHARTALGMVRPGEVVYQFPAPAEAPGSDAAR